MEQAKHTPWDFLVNDGGWEVFDTRGHTVACNLTEANARLIAAAPELLSVLKMVQEAAIDMRGEDFNLTTEQWDVFRAAITKATGATQ